MDQLQRLEQMVMDYRRKGVVYEYQAVHVLRQAVSNHLTSVAHEILGPARATNSVPDLAVLAPEGWMTFEWWHRKSPPEHGGQLLTGSTEPGGNSVTLYSRSPSLVLRNLGTGSFHDVTCTWSAPKGRLEASVASSKRCEMVNFVVEDGAIHWAWMAPHDYDALARTSFKQEDSVRVPLVPGLGNPDTERPVDIPWSVWAYVEGIMFAETPMWPDVGVIEVPLELTVRVARPNIQRQYRVVVRASTGRGGVTSSVPKEPTLEDAAIRNILKFMVHEVG